MLVFTLFSQTYEIRIDKVGSVERSEAQQAAEFMLGFARFSPTYIYASKEQPRGME